MKTEAEVKEMLDLVEDCRDFEGMTYKDGVKYTLEWILFNGDAPYTEEDKE